MPCPVWSIRPLSLAGWRIYLEYERWRVNCPGCGGVHVEHLDWLARATPSVLRRMWASCAGQGGGRDGTSVGRCEYNSSAITQKAFLRSFPSRLLPPPLREPSLKQPHSTLYRRRASLCCYRSGCEFSIPQLPIHHLPALVSDGLANDPRLLGRAPVSVPCSILDPRCFSSVIAFLPLVKRTAAFVKPSTS